MQPWQYLITPNFSGSQNMQFDLKLFGDFEKGLIPPTLRIYSWRPSCISFGYSQKIERLIDGKMVRSFGWDMVKRPTGGGIVFHNEAEVTYSLVMAIDDPVLPRGLVSSYKKISEALVCALKKIRIDADISRVGRALSPTGLRGRSTRQLCFSYSANYEITVDGRKLVGSAQKRGKKALLQQGSIFVRNDLDGVLSALKEPVDKEWYTARAISIEEILGRRVSFKKLSEALVEGFKKEFGITFQ